MRASPSAIPEPAHLNGYPIGTSIYIDTAHATSLPSLGPSSESLREFHLAIPGPRSAFDGLLPPVTQVPSEPARVLHVLPADLDKRVALDVIRAQGRATGRGPRRQ